MSKIEKFEDLHCWQQSRILVKLVYEATNEGPFKRDFGMRDQIRRASISVMNNIAEGFGRFSRREFVRFLSFSVASAVEVKSMAYAALDQNYWTAEKVNQIQTQADDVKLLSMGLVRFLKKNPEPKPDNLRT